MYSLKRSATRTGQLGKPLPIQFGTWDTAQVQFRRGATSMIAGIPGSFKSVLALNMAAWWASRQHLSVLYFSADSDEYTVRRRVTGIITGNSQARIETSMDANPHFCDAELSKLGNIEWVYDRMNAEGVKDHIEAFEVVYGAYPEAVFVDNLIDFAESPDDWAGMLLFIREMDAVARKTKAHICILHHAKIRTENKRSGWPPGDWEVTGKVTQLSRMVITVASEGRYLYWAPIKNTSGPQDREANMRYGFFVKESMRIKDTGYKGVASG